MNRAEDQDLLRSQIERLVGPDLEKQGYRLVEADATRVRYEGDLVDLEFTAEPRDGDVGLYFGRLATPERFSFLLYLQSVAPDHPAASGRVVSSAEEVEEDLRSIADALRRYGQPILDGDSAVFERMEKVRWWDFAPGALED